jgi:glycerol-3-phosphate dehydrogenase
VKFGFPQTLTPLNPLVTVDWLERARRQHRLWRPDLPEEITALAADRHGLEAEALLADVKVSNNPWEAYWCAEARHAVKTTMCLHLVDFYLRRTPLALSRTDHGLPYADAVARTMGELLNWDLNREKAEINALQNQLASDFAATISG